MRRKGKRILAFVLSATLILGGMQFFPHSVDEVEAADATRYGWNMYDNVSEDSLVITDYENRGKVLQVTKGNGTSSDWVSLATPKISVTGGETYQLSFSKLLDTGASIGVRYYEINSQGGYIPGTGIDLKMMKGDGASDGWSSETGRFTVGESVTKVEIRIYCRGTAGLKLYFDDFALNPVTSEQPIAWFDTNVWACAGENQETERKITNEECGYADTGSLHFKKTDTGDNTALSITQSLTYPETGTYVFEAYIKGDTISTSSQRADSAGVLLYGGGRNVHEESIENGVFITEEYYMHVVFNIDSNNWTRVRFEFDISATTDNMVVWIPNFGDCEFDIDNVKVYKEDDASQKNLVQNGDFYKDNSKISYFGETWEYTGGNANDNTIILDESGHTDMGSLHFSKATTATGDLQITEPLTYTTGKTYVFEAYVKGDTISTYAQAPDYANSGDIVLVGNGEWVADSVENGVAKAAPGYNLQLVMTVDSDNWTRVSGKFKMNSESSTLYIRIPNYGACDYYIDNVKIYREDDVTKTNIVQNGDFYKDNSKEIHFGQGDVWTYEGEDSENDYKITNEQFGHADMGSLHFKKLTTAQGNGLKIKQHLTYPETGTYVFEAYVKGDTIATSVDNSARVLLYGEGRDVHEESIENGVFVTEQYYMQVRFNVNSDDWTRISFKFDKSAEANEMVIEIPTYGDCEFSIDNIKIYKEDDASQKNLVQNGDFYRNVVTVDTYTNLLTNGDFNQLIIAELKGTSLSLDGNIGVNFYMSLNNVPDTAIMRFTLPNGTVETVKIPENATENGYCFTAKVAAKEMTADIKAQMFLEDGITAISDEYTYMVKQYADVILNGEYSDATKDLVKAMLHYGAYSQTYFNSPHSGSTLPNVDLEVLDLTSVSIGEEYKAVVTAADSVAKLKSAQLVLKSGTTMKMYFELVKPADTLTILVDDQEAITEIEGNICTVILENIAAHNLNKVMKITISDGTDTLTVENSAMTYAYNVLQYSASSETLENVVKSMYLYNVVAHNYMDAQ